MGWIEGFDCYCIMNGIGCGMKGKAFVLQVDLVGHMTEANVFQNGMLFLLFAVSDSR